MFQVKGQQGITALVGLLLVVGISFAAERTIDEIIAKQDELYRSKSSYAKMVMEIVTPHWERTLEMEAWSEGMDKTFIVINSPKKERGISTLRIGKEMWNYLPKTDKVMKIPPSMMASSWMGSDFSNDDLVKESSMRDDYEYELYEPDSAEEGLIYVQLVPKEETASVWGKIILSVREADYLPVREEFYDEKGRLMRVMTFKDIKTIGGRELPTVMELVPQNKKGNRTTIRYEEARFDIKLDESIFTLRNLQRKR